MIKKLLLLFLLIPSLVFAEDILKVRIDLFEGGQNSFDNADVLQSNQGQVVQNVVLNRKGQLSKRTGQLLFANDVSNTAFSGIGTFYPDSSNKYILVASGVSVLRSNDSAVNWASVNPSNPLTPGNDTEFIQANNLLFILNGQDYTPYYNGSTWFPGVNSSASCPVSTTAAWLRNYLFVAGHPTNTDWVYFSNNLAPQTFTPTDIVKINTGDGQKIVRIEPFKLNELIIYKTKSIFVLDITGSTPLSDWTVQPLTKIIGCAAARSVVSVGNDHLFLSSEPFAVRTLVRSQFDKILVDILSTQIQDIFDGTGDVVLNKTYVSKACAIVYDNKYFLAIPTGNSTVNNTVLVYDFITKSWSVIDGWFPASWIEFINNLYYMDANDGRVVQCLTGNTGDITEGPGLTSASEPTVGISYDYQSMNLDFGNPENYKQLDALDLEFEAVGSYNADIYIELDDSGWQNIGTMSMAGGGVILPENLPFTLTASGLARKTFQLQRYGEFKKIKIRVVQSGLSELCNLHNFTCYARVKPWRREQ